MEPWQEMLMTVVSSVFASSGFFALLQALHEKKSARSKMILGLGHDRIIFLCKEFIKQGYITPDDYENLYTYLYQPYEAMGGNGTAKRLMEQVQGLPSQPPTED